jgi:hypothetical protein
MKAVAQAENGLTHGCHDKAWQGYRTSFLFSRYGEMRNNEIVYAC